MMINISRLGLTFLDFQGPLQVASSCTIRLSPAILSWTQHRLWAAWFLPARLLPTKLIAHGLLHIVQYSARLLIQAVVGNSLQPLRSISGRWPLQLVSRSALGSNSMQLTLLLEYSILAMVKMAQILSWPISMERAFCLLIGTYLAKVAEAVGTRMIRASSFPRRYPTASGVTYALSIKPQTGFSTTMGCLWVQIRHLAV